MPSSQSMAQKIKLIMEWAPVLGYAQKISDAQTDQQFVMALGDLLAFLATKTEVSFDDQLIAHLEAVVASDEGKALIEWAAALLDGIVAMEVPPEVTDV